MINNSRLESRLARLEQDQPKLVLPPQPVKEPTLSESYNFWMGQLDRAIKAIEEDRLFLSWFTKASGVKFNHFLIPKWGVTPTESNELWNLGSQIHSFVYSLKEYYDFDWPVDLATYRELLTEVKEEFNRQFGDEMSQEANTNDAQ